MARRKAGEAAARWKAHVESWQSSGLSLRAFSEREKLYRSVPVPSREQPFEAGNTCVIAHSPMFAGAAIQKSKKGARVEVAPLVQATDSRLTRKKRTAARAPTDLMSPILAM